MILLDHRHIADPYFNLATEEYLVRHADCSQHDILLLYVNAPSIVVGKNQSIYREVNLPYLRQSGVPVCRRVSGGGTVYHDAGNLSFAFISAFAEHKVNNYLHFNAPIIAALQKAGIDAKADARNNILAGEKKISGNAQFTDRRNILSHGTLLFDANLDNLRGALKQNDFMVETKAVSSVRSSVANIKGLSRHWPDLNAFIDYLLTELPLQGTYAFTEADKAAVTEMADKQYSSYGWIYGRTPETTLRKDGVSVTITDGLITGIEQEGSAILPELMGQAFSYEHLLKTPGEGPGAENLLVRLFFGS